MTRPRRSDSPSAADRKADAMKMPRPQTGALTQLLLVGAILPFLMHTRPTHAATSEWVRPGPDGKLVYKTTPAGDQIMDFSHAGYIGGGVALPDVPVKRTVKPTVGDGDADAIQAAID
jgi:hypothetical protein